jgi:hypothetical protein
MADYVSPREQFKKRGMMLGIDLVLKSSRKPYIRVDIFLDHFQIGVLPDLAKFHTLDEFFQEFASFLRDNCSTSIITDLNDSRTQARVVGVSFPPHTAQLFQISFKWGLSFEARKRLWHLR